MGEEWAGVIAWDGVAKEMTCVIFAFFGAVYDKLTGRKVSEGTCRLGYAGLVPWWRSDVEQNKLI
jgi:hypothetical protein